MATNFFRTGYHFEKFKSQVATRKKKLHALYSLCLCQRWLIVNLSCLSLLRLQIYVSKRKYKKHFPNKR